MKRSRLTAHAASLNLESPGAFSGRLIERRWALVTALLGQGGTAVRALARREGHDVKRVHQDVRGLAEPGLVERDEAGGVVWPYADVRIDMPSTTSALPPDAWPICAAHRMRPLPVGRFLEPVQGNC